MWIEVYFDGKKSLFNSANITIIKKYVLEDTYLLEIEHSHSGESFYFETKEQIDAFYEGFILALNGLDFYYNGNGSLDEYKQGHIKPILQSKNAVLYQHMLLKEVIGDRK